MAACAYPPRPPAAAIAAGGWLGWQLGRRRGGGGEHTPCSRRAGTLERQRPCAVVREKAACRATTPSTSLKKIKLKKIVEVQGGEVGRQRSSGHYLPMQRAHTTRHRRAGVPAATLLHALQPCRSPSNRRPDSSPLDRRQLPSYWPSLAPAYLELSALPSSPDSRRPASSPLDRLPLPTYSTLHRVHLPTYPRSNRARTAWRSVPRPPGRRTVLRASEKSNVRGHVRASPHFPPLPREYR